MGEQARGNFVPRGIGKALETRLDLGRAWEEPFREEPSSDYLTLRSLIRHRYAIGWGVGVTMLCAVTLRN